MDLSLNSALADAYHSWPQKIRVMTETWVHQHLFCPACGCRTLNRCIANSPVADFVCDTAHCTEQFELKSKNGLFGQKIVDGAYNTMQARLAGNQNPNLILLSYERQKLSVSTLEVIPKQFFVMDIIESRPPLSLKARRRGWVGCNILIGQIPTFGRIRVLSPGQNHTVNDVVQAWRNVLFVRNLHTDKARGWLMAVMDVVDKQVDRFTLRDVYRYAPELAERFSGNRHVHAKIRQQLQLLRDNGIIDFLGHGNYSKKT